jgi:nucleoid DNA-binding protein
MDYSLIPYYQALIESINDAAATTKSSLSNPLIDKETAENVVKESLEVVKTNYYNSISKQIPEVIANWAYQLPQSTIEKLKWKNIKNRAFWEFIDSLKIAAAITKSSLSNPLIDKETAENVVKESLKALKTSLVNEDKMEWVEYAGLFEFKQYSDNVLNSLKRKNSEDIVTISSWGEEPNKRSRI